jgi:hypothetical protein
MLCGVRNAVSVTLTHFSFNTNSISVFLRNTIAYINIHVRPKLKEKVSVNRFKISVNCIH